LLCPGQKRLNVVKIPLEVGGQLDGDFYAHVAGWCGRDEFKS
jgi:hypothetical protein